MRNDRAQDVLRRSKAQFHRKTKVSIGFVVRYRKQKHGHSSARITTDLALAHTVPRRLCACPWPLLPDRYVWQGRIQTCFTSSPTRSAAAPACPHRILPLLRSFVHSLQLRPIQPIGYRQPHAHSPTPPEPAECSALAFLRRASCGDSGRVCSYKHRGYGRTRPGSYHCREIRPGYAELPRESVAFLLRFVDGSPYFHFTTESSA